MSQAYFTNLWKTAQTDVAGILRTELPQTKPRRLPNDRKQCLDVLAARYITYSMIYNELQICVDHIVHPQKCILILKLLEAVTGRLVEMRYELERLSVCEYINLVDICHVKKVHINDLELSLSRTQSLIQMNSIRQRAIFLDYILQTTGEEGHVELDSTVVCTISEAVLLIQKNQRAYVGRITAKKLKIRQGILKGMAKRSSDVESHTKGLIKFQSRWRGYMTRKTLTAIRVNTAEFIDMRMPEGRNLEIEKKQIHSKDHEKQLEYDDEYRKNVILKTEELLETDGPKMENDMRREIRQWIVEYRDIMGAFPIFPSEEDGGSLALFSDMSVQQLERDMNELEEEVNSGKKGAKKKKKKGKDKKKKKEGKKGKKKGKDDDFIYELKPSNFVTTEIVPCTQEYGEYWLFNEDCKENRQQRYDRVLLMEEVKKDVEGTIRKQVDTVIRAELDQLELGIERKPPGKVKPKKEKKKKGGKKKKKGKDLTEGIPLEELYKELILAGVVKRVPIVHLTDYIGEVNLLCPKDNKDMEFKHCLGDVRKMIFDYAILPMSSDAVHAGAPLRKSIMIAGPHGSGKKMLVNAVCTELGANLFDLSPENIEGIYQDKEGQKRLMQLVMKVAKLMEPSVIHIGNCDRMFTKKLPPGDTTRPARLKKDIMKAMKSITPNDRILLIGTSKTPFGASIGPLFKMYERLIFIYPPSSRSRYALWQRFITDCKGIMPWPQFQLSPLTHVSKGYTAGDIKSATVEVLTENRLKKQNPLVTQEFVTRLAFFDPVFVEEQLDFEKWLRKTTLKKKLQKIEGLEEENEEVMSLL